MTRNILITIFIVLLIGVFAGGYYFVKHKNTGAIPVVEISKEDIKGCYVAKLGKDVYTLDIETEDKNGAVAGLLAYNNYQKDSSSGSFTGNYDGAILLGNYSFDSEGMHSDRQLIFKKVANGFEQGFGAVTSVGSRETLKDVNSVTYDPKFTFVKSENCTEHFVENDKIFSLDYNSFFSAYEGAKSPTPDWRVDAPQNGVLLVTVSAPRTYMPGTNFGDGVFKVGSSNDPEAIKSCTDDTIDLNEKENGTLDIGGYTFTKFTKSDAGAGNLYDTTSYRGIVDGDCYAVEYTIHSLNIGNYEPSQGVKEFDKSKIEKEFENIIKSLKFLISSD